MVKRESGRECFFPAGNHCPRKVRRRQGNATMAAVLDEIQTIGHAGRDVITIHFPH